MYVFSYRCKKHYCIQHRHLTECEEKSKEEKDREIEKYTQPIKQFNEAKATVDKQVKNKFNNLNVDTQINNPFFQIQNSLSQAKRGSKHKEMASKLQLMKIKNKATGQNGIPTTNRVYFNISFGPSQNSEKIVPVFVSKTWSLGENL